MGQGKKQPRSKRTFLGRVDPDSGEIIPKKTRGSSKTEPYKRPDEETEILAALKKDLQEKDMLISDLRIQLNEISKKYDAAKKALNRIANLSAPFSERE